MVHGSSHTAACLESTPDGREGWYPYFVRKGISTYLVDQAGRGRSGFDESVIHEAAAMIRAGDVQNGLEAAAGVPENHRQRRMDELVRSPGSAGIEHPHRQADPARRSERSAGRRRCTPTITSLRILSTPPTQASPRAPERSAARPRGRAITTRSNYYKELVPNSEVDSAGFGLRRLRSEGDRACQYLDADGSRRCWSKSSGARWSRRIRNRALWATTWSAFSRSAAIWIC